MEPWPKHPPGRSDRKALHHLQNIHRMRQAGYSFEAIRLALVEVGVCVSRTTLKREAARKLTTIIDPPEHGASVMALTPTAQANAAFDSSPAHPRTTTSDRRASGPAMNLQAHRQPRSLRESEAIAQAFMKDFNDNPLLRRETK